ncbi:hypothetical protein JCM1841_004677 [Sporobolomyces salmonicolor]
MLPRIPIPSTVQLPAPSSAAPPSFPGLVSSLRPIKRLSSQLATEATLLHRFSYKNKNQHKGAGWWRKVIEADRVVARTLVELEGFLREFGLSKDSDEAALIKREMIVSGVLRLPRAMLIVEKTVQVLLKCASILEQLIHSRAFLAFALIVVALISRLHSLTVVLYDELSRTSAVLMKLVQTNELTPALGNPLSRLPKNLRRFISADPPREPTSVPLSNLPTPRDAGSPADTPASSATDDIGTVVTRAHPRASGNRTRDSTPSSTKPFLHPDVAATPSTSAGQSPAPRAPAPTSTELQSPKAKKLKRPPSSAPAEPSPLAALPSPPGLFPFDLDAPVPVRPSALPTLATAGKRAADKGERGEGEGDSEVGRKKKKKVRRSGGAGDEIDAIFG